MSFIISFGGAPKEPVAGQGFKYIQAGLLSIAPLGLDMLFQ